MQGGKCKIELERLAKDTPIYTDRNVYEKESEKSIESICEKEK